MIVRTVMYRNWNAQKVVDLNTLPFEQWIKDNVSQWMLNMTTTEEMALRLPCQKSLQRTIRYLRMKAFRNHFWVDDPTIARLQIYDVGVASIFHVPTKDAQDLSINYVGILKDILEVNYRLLYTPVILMKCEWMKRVDNQGNNTNT
jgi:hypothetical protein